MSTDLKWIKPLAKRPILPTPRPAVSKSERIVREFIDSETRYAEILDTAEYASLKSLARSLGRILHNKEKGLDPDNEIEVRSDKEKNKVYLLRKD